MSSKTLEGMVKAYENGFLSSTGSAHTRADAMRAVLNWLVDNVSDEMAKALRDSLDECPPDKWLPAIGYAKAISAAIRAAGDGR
jgi:hypothetical protein